MAPWPQENATNGSMRHSYMHMQTGAATDAAATATATATATQRLQSTTTARAASRATNCHDNTRHSSPPPPPPPAIPLARKSVTGHGTAGTSKVSACCVVLSRACASACPAGLRVLFVAFVAFVRWLLLRSSAFVRQHNTDERTDDVAMLYTTTQRYNKCRESVLCSLPSIPTTTATRKQRHNDDNDQRQHTKCTVREVHEVPRSSPRTHK